MSHRTALHEDVEALLGPSGHPRGLITLKTSEGNWPFEWDDLVASAPVSGSRHFTADHGPWHLEAQLVPRSLDPEVRHRGLAPGVEVRAVEVRLRLTNRGPSPLTLTGWRALEVDYQPAAQGPGGHDLWAYCGASHPDRPDWLRPVEPGFAEPGWLGMNDTDYGGGNPVAAVWNSLGAVALGCLSPVPEVLGLPLTRAGIGPVSLGLAWNAEGAGTSAQDLSPGEHLELPPFWMASTDRDGPTLLAAWRLTMEALGARASAPSEASREPTWCAWGYERGFTLDQVEGALPKVADVGIRWVTLDDGWQSEEGDVTLNPAKFPGGEAQMRSFVDGLHARGLKAMLWWIPLAADPQSRWFQDHPDTVVRDAAGQPSLITFWDNWILCPSHPLVRTEVRRQLAKFFTDWGFDGLKIDGQHLNAVPACQDGSHGHADPLEAHRRLPEFWQMVKQTAEELKPGSTILFCPCGTTYSFHTLPHFDVPVASDPHGSWQVRTKGLVFKALMAPDCAFHGDHVELSDRERDFASTVGVGGLVDTKFTWPPGSGNPSILKPGGHFDLLPDGERRLRSWLEAAGRQQVDRADALFGLTRFGFEAVETHVFDAGDHRFVSLYARAGEGEDSLDAPWSGPIEFHGLAEGLWSVTAWAEAGEVVRRTLGRVSADSPVLSLTFAGSLLTRLDRVPSSSHEVN